MKSRAVLCLSMLAAGLAAAEPPGLAGRVLCGYQGWFTCAGDGAERGWIHWSRDRARLAPGTATVDLWPDVSGLPAEDRFDTEFRHPDGRVAQVFSSQRAGTVDRHFQWMAAHGIDGVFLQRFGAGLAHEPGRRARDAVLGHVRSAARRHDRVWALMYDLTGMKAADVPRLIEDWRRLRDITGDPGYLHHAGRPLVAVWGVGFNDGRQYGVAECGQLVDALQADGLSVMLGVPMYWRVGARDAVADPALTQLCARVQAVSPWAVGRYRDDATLAAGTSVRTGDVAWCRARGVFYLPVVFPGFSWHNLKGGPSDDIPRRGGRFLWSQFASVRALGLDAAYLAMFDEVDEGTAILPCVSNPPDQPGSRFVSYQGVAPDHYLRLTGRGRALLRGEVGPELPDFVP